MKSVKAKLTIEFFLFSFFFLFFIFFLKARLFTENFHGQVLSNRVYSFDGHYGQIVSLGRWIISRREINSNQ